jgi:hypothetical protein
MPNWVDQELHVLGPKADIDRFVRVGFGRAGGPHWVDHLRLTRLCPIPRAERTDETRQTAWVVMRCRTRTEAFFSIRTRYNHPVEFYQRLPKFWPRLVVFASVNEELGQAGGIVAVMNGEVHDLVRDYDADYDHRQHKKEVRAVVKRIDELVLDGRPWRILPCTAWTHRYIPFDAWFAEDMWFYFHTRDEMAAFAARFRARSPMRLVGHEWKRTALRHA